MVNVHPADMHRAATSMSFSATEWGQVPNPYRSRLTDCSSYGTDAVGMALTEALADLPDPVLTYITDVGTMARETATAVHEITWSYEDADNDSDAELRALAAEQLAAYH